jgi:thioredoxin 1
MPGLSSRFRLPTSWHSCRIRATICQHNMQRILFSLLLVSLVAMPACTKTKKPDAKPDTRVVVTAGSYDQLIKESKKPIVLDFWASWCGPCKVMDPILAEASVERPDVIFGKVNVDERPKLAQKCEIRAIPTLLIIVEGKVVKTSVGVVKKEALLQLVDEAVKKKPQA